jgi:hypothetical protein
MVPNRLNVRWLRPALASLALAALALLGGCGGGSGAPNNPFAPKPVPPGPVAILPSSATVYSSTPATLTVTGGVPPYFVVSSDASILPLGASTTSQTIVLLPAIVTAPDTVVITATDSEGVQAQASVTVNPAPIFNTLVITPASAACGTNTICTGGTATATVTVTGPGGAPIPGRQVRFDVVSGAFAIESNDPANPLVSTLTVVADQFGMATVIILANVTATTQPGLLRATELTTGEQQTAAFTIVQTINGSAVLSVVPSTATITGAFINQCSAGFRVDYYIYGGTPPYRVTSTFPQAVNLLNSPVLVEGGAFTAITNGTCVNPLVFSIVDANGLETTATLINNAGTATPPGPTPPAALQILPASTTFAACTGQQVNFVILGGTPPYNVSSSTPGVGVVPPIVNKSGGMTLVGPFLPGANTTSIVVIDSGSPQQSVTGTVICTS